MRVILIHFFLLFSVLFSQETGKVFILEYEGVINPVAMDIIRSAIERADEEGGECLIIQMDTPGGLMKSMQQIVKDILAAPIPVVVYVAPGGSRAGSAGVFITYAAHVAAMAPGTNIGAAHPVNLQAGADTSDTMMDKVTNDAVAFIRSIAEKRGRNEAWAEDAVRESASIPASEALELNVIDVIAPETDSLIAWLDGRDYEVLDGRRTLNTANARKVRIEISWRLKLLNVISDPNIAYILLLIGIYGIFFELYNPGAILPGVAGAISLILAFYALHTLPVNYAGLLLILLAIILFVAEIKIPSYGLLTVGGIISLVMGSIMLFKDSLPFIQISWKVIVFATVITTLFFVFALGLAFRAQRRKPVTGREGIVGEMGEAVADFSRGRGQVAVHGEIWDAKSDEKIKKGDAVKVESIENLKIMVKKLT
ncbi:MAG: nodulation protein NfeD [Calditrichaeota bacterium]|nr:nodulation protein NfeD [Calditrichota bacterium]RQV92560.1 MAG: nodulation protein NfeD [bacterium]RQV99634.1 MAG: nodulation protein NfeD [Calditrichota bacterium]